MRGDNLYQAVGNELIATMESVFDETKFYQIFDNFRGNSGIHLSREQRDIFKYACEKGLVDVIKSLLLKKPELKNYFGEINSYGSSIFELINDYSLRDDPEADAIKYINFLKTTVALNIAADINKTLLPEFNESSFTCKLSLVRDDNKIKDILLYAVLISNTEAVRILLNAHPKIDVFLLGIDRNLLFIIATINNNPEILSLLINHHNQNTNSNQVTDCYKKDIFPIGNNLLTLAMMFNADLVVMQIISELVVKNALLEIGQDAVDYAIRLPESKKYVKALLNNGVPVTFDNFFTAFVSKNWLVTDLLLNCDTKSLNKGQTKLNYPVIKRLINIGAKYDGGTLEKAATNDNLKTFIVFLRTNNLSFNLPKEYRNDYISFLRTKGRLNQVISQCEDFSAICRLTSQQISGNAIKTATIQGDNPINGIPSDIFKNILQLLIATGWSQTIVSIMLTNRFLYQAIGKIFESMNSQMLGAEIPSDDVEVSMILKYAKNYCSTDSKRPPRHSFVTNEKVSNEKSDTKSKQVDEEHTEFQVGVRFQEMAEKGGRDFGENAKGLG